MKRVRVKDITTELRRFDPTNAGRTTTQILKSRRYFYIVQEKEVISVKPIEFEYQFYKPVIMFQIDKTEKQSGKLDRILEICNTVDIPKSEWGVNIDEAICLEVQNIFSSK